MIKVDRCVWLGAALLLAAGCGDGKGEGTELSEKDAYELAIKELADPIGVVAAFQPYLKDPEQKKYAPQRRPDLLKSQFFAATAIRHAANGARQRGERSKSSVTKGMTDALAKLGRACTEPRDPSDVVKCAKAVTAFDASLEPHAAKAKSAGASKPFPRVAKEFITDGAKKELAPFTTAMGPAEKEKEYLAKRFDEKATVDDLLAACDSAKAEVAATEQKMQGAEEPVRELAVVHKYAVETQCNRFGSVIKAHRSLEACEKKTDTPECKTACGKVKREIDKELPAAAFMKVQTDYDETCTDKKKK